MYLRECERRKATLTQRCVSFVSVRKVCNIESFVDDFSVICTAENKKKFSVLLKISYREDAFGLGLPIWASIFPLKSKHNKPCRHLRNDNLNETEIPKIVFFFPL